MLEQQQQCRQAGQPEQSGGRLRRATEVAEPAEGERERECARSRSHAWRAEWDAPSLAATETAAQQQRGLGQTGRVAVR
eukprot:scaffold281515_cov40-Tisochrysis_lutea.AAC.2